MSKSGVGISTGAGKGDTPRPVNQDKYRENYDRIFGKGKRDGDKDKKSQ